MKSLPLLVTLFAFIGVSCSSSSPSTRIEKNPEVYDSLNERDKELVSRGQIEDGMNSQAVLLAWGKPASRMEGQSKGTSFERWAYTGLTPVYSHSFHGGFGYGSGGYRGGGFRGGGFGHGFRRGGRGFGRHGHGFFSSSGFGTSISYIPSPVAWVKFVNGRVDSWQRGRSR